MILTKELYVNEIEKILGEYNDTLSIQDIASILGSNKETIRKLVAKGEIESVACGRSFIIAKPWLLSFIRTSDKDFRPYSVVIVERRKAVVEFCAEPRTWQELLVHTGYCNKSHLQKHITRPLLCEGRIQLTIPDKPHDNRQKYVAT